MGGDFSSLGPMRRNNPTQMRRDVILQDNPDFAIPGMGGAPRYPGRGRGGGMRGSMVGGPGRMPPPSGMGMDGPYGAPMSSMREI